MTTRRRSSARLVNAAVVRPWLPARPKDAHKGTSGRVAIVAGSRGMTGAPALAAWGAARGGAGLLRVFVPSSAQAIVAARGPLEATTAALDEDRDGRLSAAGARRAARLVSEFEADIVAMGPGLGVTPGSKALVDHFLFRGRTPVVADADALNALAERRRPAHFTAPAILTPHAGEIARLLGLTTRAVLADRPKAAGDLARRFGCVCLLKGPGTIVTDGRAFWQNTTGNPAMATGGMGDVLTGFIAALWAQMRERPDAALRAAALGAYLHGLAGDIAVSRFPEGTLLASDLIAFFPDAFRRTFPRP